MWFTAECNSSEVQVAVRGFGALKKDHYRSHFPVDVNVWWAALGVGSFHQCSQTVFSEKPLVSCNVTKKSICSLQSFNHDGIISKTCTPAIVFSESPPSNFFDLTVEAWWKQPFFSVLCSNRLFGGMRWELIPLWWCIDGHCPEKVQ